MIEFIRDGVPEAMREAFGIPITYYRGTPMANIIAILATRETPGSDSAQLDPLSSPVFIIKKSDLTAAGIVNPAVGDHIWADVKGTGTPQYYLVSAPPGFNAYDEADPPYNLHWKIRTRLP